MGSKLSSKALKKLAALEEAKRKWDRVHALVEQAATQPASLDVLLRGCRHASEDVSRIFSNSGFGPLADAADGLRLVMRRAGAFSTKLGAMREVVGSVYTGIERAVRAVHDDERKTGASNRQ